MKIFLDTASVSELKEGVAMGILDGCTTNPSLIAKEKRPFRPLVEEICSLVPGPVSLEVVATDISPFLGRLDDISHVGMDLIRQILSIYANYGFKTQVLAASIRNPLHVVDAALAGAHVATMPFAVLEQLTKHPLTDIGLKKFLDDWNKAGVKL